MAGTSFGVLITGDSRGAVKAIDLTSKQIKDLEGVTEKATRKIKTDTTAAADGFSSMAKTAAKMGAAVGAAGVALGSLVLREVIRNTSEQEKVMAQLNATLKSTGGVAGRTATELAATASALQKVTTYGDEAIVSAQSLLATFKNVNKDGAIFDRTTRAILDMSTAMGTDLKSSALQLGKALENPTKGISALTRSGVSFSEAQKDVIKGLAETGRLAEAQTLILAELETQFGGSAEAARNTMGGALLALQNSWGDLFEVQQTSSAGMTQSINELNATISDPGFKSAMDSVTTGLIDIVNWSARAAAGIVQTFKYVTQSDGPLTKLKEEIDEVSEALTRAENKGFWREAEKLKTKLAGLKKEYEELGAKVNAANRPMAELSPILVTAEQRTVKLTAANVSLAKSCDTVAASVDDLSPIIVTATRKTVDFGKTSEEVGTATSGIWEEARSTLSKMFFELAADGANVFDTLVDGFKNTLVQMAADAAANQIFIQIGTVATNAGYTAVGGALTKAGGGTAGSTAAGAAGGAAAGGGTNWAAAGGYAALVAGIFRTVDDLQNNRYGPGDVLTGTSLNIKYGDSLGGLGKYLFPDTEKLDFLGVGKTVNKYFGQQNDGKNAGYTNFNLGTGANNAAGVGKTFDQANVDSASGLAGALQQFAAAIGGSSLSGAINVGAGKINYAGKSYSSADAFLADAYKDVIRGADNLNDALKPLITSLDGTADEMARFAQAIVSIDTMSKTNTVSNAVTEFGKAQLSAMDAYKLHTDALQEQIRAFDGSLSAAESLNAVLYENKTAAYSFAMSIQSIGRSISDMAGSQAASIRESVLTPQQLLNKRYDQRDSLAASLLTEKDPERAAATAQRLLEVNQQIFNSITDDQQLLFAENFAKVAEDTNNVAQYILDQSLKGLQTTQDEINKQVADMLNSAASKQQQAADTQLQAANTMLEASYRWIKGNQVAV